MSPNIAAGFTDPLPAAFTSVIYQPVSLEFRRAHTVGVVEDGFRLSTISCNRRGALLQGKGPVLIDFGLQALLAHWFRDHIDLANQQSRELPLKLVKLVEVIESAGGEVIGQPDRNIKIGIRRGITSSGGPKRLRR